MMKQARRLHGWRASLAAPVGAAAVVGRLRGVRACAGTQCPDCRSRHPAECHGTVVAVAAVGQAVPAERRRSSSHRTRTRAAKQLHARLAYARLTGTYDPELLTALYECSIPYLGVVRDVLQPHSDQLATSLWDTLHNAGEPAGKRFRAGVALATYATESEQWSADDYALLAEQLVQENPIHQPQLWQDLLPVSAEADSRPGEAVRQPGLPESQQIGAANALASFARDDGPRLARLLTTATAAQYEILYPLVSSWPDGTAKAVLADVVARQPADNLSQTDRVALGQRRAGAAISLLRLGEVEKSSRRVPDPGRPGVAHPVRASLPGSGCDGQGTCATACAQATRRAQPLRAAAGPG